MADGKARRGLGWGRLPLWGGIALLLSLPAVAMRFGADGVVWTGSDFVVMGVMLGGVGLLIELVARARGGWRYKAGAAAAVLTGFLTIWVNLAVGMIGSEDNSYNLAFFGVVLLAAGGACVARLAARNMAFAMVAAAFAQAVAALIGMASDPRGGVFSLVFTLFWLGSAGLFHLAAARERRAA